MKQTELAQKMGVSNSQITRWLDGETMPRPDKAVKLCRLLNVPLDALFLGK